MYMNCIYIEWDLNLQKLGYKPYIHWLADTTPPSWVKGECCTKATPSSSKGHQFGGPCSSLPPTKTWKRGEQIQVTHWTWIVHHVEGDTSSPSVVLFGWCSKPTEHLPKNGSLEYPTPSTTIGRQNLWVRVTNRFHGCIDKSFSQIYDPLN